MYMARNYNYPTAVFFFFCSIGFHKFLIKLFLYYRFGRKKGVVIPMLLAAVGAAGSVLLTTDDESNKGTVSIVEP